MVILGGGDSAACPGKIRLIAVGFGEATTAVRKEEVVTRRT